MWEILWINMQKLYAPELYLKMDFWKTSTRNPLCWIFFRVYVTYYFLLYMTSKGSTACHTRSNCIFWTNTIPTFDCSPLEENATSRSSAFAGTCRFFWFDSFYWLITSWVLDWACMYACTCSPPFPSSLLVFYPSVLFGFM